MSSPAETLDEIRALPTMTVLQLSKLMGVGRNQAYAAVREGIVPSVRFGASIRIPTAPVLELLGRAPKTESEPGPASPGAATHEPAEGAQPHDDTSAQPTPPSRTGLPRLVVAPEPRPIRAVHSTLPGAGRG